MASYPGPKVHRTNRRKLGRGQYPTAPAAIITVTDTSTTATLTFSVPVVVSGTIPMTVSGGLTFVSQTIVSPTVVTQVWSAALSAKTYAIAANAANVRTVQGGGVAAVSGTFS
jgi:hypothetical protein